MKRFAILALALLAAAPAYAFTSYNLVSALLETQGRFLAATIRNFFINNPSAPSFTLLFLLVISCHLLYTCIQHWQLDDLAPAVLKKIFYFSTISTLLYTNAPQDAAVYSFVNGQNIQVTTPYQQGLTYAYQDQSKTISLVNYTAFLYADMVGNALLEQVNASINGSDPNRRMPLLLQRALSATQGVPFLKAPQVDAAHTYAKECAPKFLSQDQTRARGLSFMNSLQDSVDGVDNVAVLARLRTNILTAQAAAAYASGTSLSSMPNSSFFTCLDLRSQLIASVGDLISNRNQYFSDVASQISQTDALAEPTTLSANGLSLSDQETLLIADLLATQELGAILDNRARTASPPNTVDGTLSNPANYQYGLIGYIGSGIQQAWRVIWTDNPLWGNSKVSTDLVNFYHRAPVLYGYASVFFQIVAEFALILSLVAGRILFLYRVWLGMLVLKCLPILWVFTDSVIRGTVFVADPVAQQYLNSTGGYDPGAFQQILQHLVAIQNISVDVITYSFLLLVPFVPGVTDVFRKVAS